MSVQVAPAQLPAAVEVSEAERAELLEIARSALVAAVRDGGRGGLDTAYAALGGRCGAAFVSLEASGELRGCVGILDAARPLAETVAAAAVGAALRDGRFPPVSASELPGIEIGVSVLGPFVELDDPLAFRPGIDGLVVARGWDRGLLLPEVATTHGFDALAMLEATCRKAGLQASAWRDPRTTVLAFRTERFGGPALAEAHPGDWNGRVEPATSPGGHLVG